MFVLGGVPSKSNEMRFQMVMPSNQNEKALPKMEVGTVHVQWVRCNRAGCRCATGRPHGPYHYLFFREAGRLRKRYVPPERLAEVRAACEARVRFSRDLSASRKAARQLIEDLRKGEAR
jgi:hypothetical protein